MAALPNFGIIVSQGIDSSMVQSAQHYLRIYRLKLAMAEAGTTRPSAAGVEFFKRLVAALEGLDANSPIRLENIQGMWRFIDARSGLLLAEVQLKDDDA